MTLRAFVVLVVVWAVAIALSLTTMGKFFALLLGLVLWVVSAAATLVHLQGVPAWIPATIYLAVAIFLVVRAIIRVLQGDWHEARGYAGGVISMAGLVAVPWLAISGLDVAAVLREVVNGPA